MQNSRFPVGLDIDDVLLWYEVSLFLGYCQQHLGWAVNLQAYNETHSWQEATSGRTPAEISPVFAKFLLGNAGTQNLVPGAYEALRQLAPFCSWHCITARPVALRTVTLSVLERYCPGINFASFDWHKSLTKADVILQRGILAHVEDSTQEIELILDRGVNITIIQFPAFRGCPQRTFKDNRVIRLAACDCAQTASCLADQKKLWRHAWQQVQQEIQQRLPILSSTAAP
ncbi:MAG: hypothetical protein ABIH36_03175 [bacterium]